jgi:antitoxin HicB
MHRYTVVLTPEPDGSAWNASVPALPGCFTWGVTPDAALAHAREAIALYLEDLEAAGEPIPAEPQAARVEAVEV